MVVVLRCLREVAGRGVWKAWMPMVDSFGMIFAIVVLEDVLEDVTIAMLCPVVTARQAGWFGARSGVMS